MRNRILVFDFDGTIYRGDQPFWFYAQALSRKMSDKAAEKYLSKVSHFLNSEDSVSDFVCDNWQAVVYFAKPEVDDAMIEATFTETRKYMMQDDCILEVPMNLKQMLTEWRQHAYLVLASNSPEAACIPLVKKLGLYDSFDVVRHSARKPEGLMPLVAQLDVPLGEYAYASVGDNYINDIEPVLKANWMTVHISPRGQFPGPATVQVRNMEDAYTFIDVWVREEK